MPNANRVSGLTPVRYLNGADWTGAANVYSIATSEANLLSVGDPVKLSGSGDTLGIPGVAQATAGATAVGVLIAVGTTPNGPWCNPADLTAVQAPASKAVVYYALVVDDPMTVFEVQEGGAGAVLDASAIGENADFVAAAAATGTKVSGFYMNNNAHDTTATRNLKILGLARRADNAFGLYAKWNVLLNNHSFRTGVAGI